MRQFLAWFSIILGALICIISLFEIIELLRRSVGRQVDFSILIEILLLKLPSYIHMLSPFVIFFATVLLLWRLNSSYQIVMIRTNGQTIFQLLKPLLWMVIVIEGINLILIHPLNTQVLSRLEVLEKDVFQNTTSKMRSNSLAVLENGLWFKETPAPNQERIIHAKKFDSNGHFLEDVEIYEINPKNNFLIEHTKADSLEISEGQLFLKDPHILWNHKKNHKEIQKTPLSLQTTLTLEDIYNQTIPPESLSLWDLPKFMKVLEQSGLSTFRYQFYAWSQLSRIPYSMAMVLLAATFCIRLPRRGGALFVLGIGLIFGLIVYFLSDIIKAFGLTHKIPMHLAIWSLPLIVGLLSSSRLLHLEET